MKSAGVAVVKTGNKHEAPTEAPGTEDGNRIIVREQRILTGDTEQTLIDWK